MEIKLVVLSLLLVVGFGTAKADDNSLTAAESRDFGLSLSPAERRAAVDAANAKWLEIEAEEEKLEDEVLALEAAAELLGEGVDFAPELEFAERKFVDSDLPEFRKVEESKPYPTQRIKPLSAAEQKVALLILASGTQFESMINRGRPPLKIVKSMMAGNGFDVSEGAMRSVLVEMKLS